MNDSNGGVPSAKPFDTNGGRKWVLVWWFQGLGLMVIIAIVLKAVVGPLDDLDIKSMLDAVQWMALVAGLFVGVVGVAEIRAAGRPVDPTPPAQVGDGTEANADPVFNPDV